MTLPPQAPPVHRPTVVEPHRTVEVDHGDRRQLLRARMYLLHGANHNDPAAWTTPLPNRMRQSTAGVAPPAFPPGWA
jgi:cyanobactin biosynthesis protein (PatB/AcyB/McaB family)